MRKGILSLSMAGRGKSGNRKKTKNMELAEKTAEKKAAPAAEGGKGRVQEKMFVQTVQIPKPGMVKKKAKRKRSMVVVPQKPESK